MFSFICEDNVKFLYQLLSTVHLVNVNGHQSGNSPVESYFGFWILEGKAIKVSLPFIADIYTVLKILI